MKRRAAFVVAAIVVIGLVGGGVLYLRHRPETTSQQIARQSLNVGRFRYVNACQALPYSSYQKAFGAPVYVGSAGEQDFAEHIGHLAANGSVDSECDGAFETAPDSHMPVNLTLSEYASTAAAARVYQTDASLDDSTVAGIANASYSADDSAVDILLGNIKLRMSFGNAIENIVPSEDQIVSYVKNALPIITGNITNTSLPQTPYDITKGQPKLGSSTYFSACEYFSNQTFKDVFAADSDQSNVKLSFQYAAPQAAAQGKKGLLDTINTQCDRSNNTQDMTILVKYYKSAAEATAGAKDEADTQVQAFDVKTVATPKYGSYSVIQQNDAKQDDPKSDMVIAKNSYVVLITLTPNTDDTSNTQASTAQYERAAKDLLASLPLR